MGLNCTFPPSLAGTIQCASGGVRADQALELYNNGPGGFSIDPVFGCDCQLPDCCRWLSLDLTFPLFDYVFKAN